LPPPEAGPAHRGPPQGSDSARSGPPSVIVLSDPRNEMWLVLRAGVEVHQPVDVVAQLLHLTAVGVHDLGGQLPVGRMVSAWNLARVGVGDARARVSAPAVLEYLDGFGDDQPAGITGGFVQPARDLRGRAQMNGHVHASTDRPELLLH